MPLSNQNGDNHSDGNWQNYGASGSLGSLGNGLGQNASNSEEPNSVGAVGATTEADKPTNPAPMLNEQGQTVSPHNSGAPNSGTGREPVEPMRQSPNVPPPTSSQASTIRPSELAPGTNVSAAAPRISPRLRYTSSTRPSVSSVAAAPTPNVLEAPPTQKLKSAPTAIPNTNAGMQNSHSLGSLLHSPPPPSAGLNVPSSAPKMQPTVRPAAPSMSIGTPPRVGVGQQKPGPIPVQGATSAANSPGVTPGAAQNPVMRHPLMPGSGNKALTLPSGSTAVNTPQERPSFGSTTMIGPPPNQNRPVGSGATVVRRRPSTPSMDPRTIAQARMAQAKSEGAVGAQPPTYPRPETLRPTNASRPLNMPGGPPTPGAAHASPYLPNRSVPGQPAASVAGSAHTQSQPTGSPINRTGAPSPYLRNADPRVATGVNPSLSGTATGTASSGKQATTVPNEATTGTRIPFGSSAKPGIATSVGAGPLSSATGGARTGMGVTPAGPAITRGAELLSSATGGARTGIGVTPAGPTLTKGTEPLSSAAGGAKTGIGVTPAGPTLTRSADSLSSAIKARTGIGGTPTGTSPISDVEPLSNASEAKTVKLATASPSTPAAGTSAVGASETAGKSSRTGARVPFSMATSISHANKETKPAGDTSSATIKLSQPSSTDPGHAEATTVGSRVPFGTARRASTARPQEAPSTDKASQATSSTPVPKPSSSADLSKSQQSTASAIGRPETSERSSSHFPSESSRRIIRTGMLNTGLHGLQRTASKLSTSTAGKDANPIVPKVMDMASQRPPEEQRPSIASMAIPPAETLEPSEPVTSEASDSPADQSSPESSGRGKTGMLDTGMHGLQRTASKLSASTAGKDANPIVPKVMDMAGQNPLDEEEPSISSDMTSATSLDSSESQGTDSKAGGKSSQSQRIPIPPASKDKNREDSSSKKRRPSAPELTLRNSGSQRSSSASGSEDTRDKKPTPRVGGRVRPQVVIQTVDPIEEARLKERQALMTKRVEEYNDIQSYYAHHMALYEQQQSHFEELIQNPATSTLERNHIFEQQNAIYEKQRALFQLQSNLYEYVSNSNFDPSIPIPFTPIDGVSTEPDKPEKDVADEWAKMLGGDGSADERDKKRRKKQNRKGLSEPEFYKIGRKHESVLERRQRRMAELKRWQKQWQYIYRTDTFWRRQRYVGVVVAIIGLGLLLWILNINNFFKWMGSDYEPPLIPIAAEGLKTDYGTSRLDVLVNQVVQTGRHLITSNNPYNVMKLRHGATLRLDKFTDVIIDSVNTRKDESIDVVFILKQGRVYACNLPGSTIKVITPQIRIYPVEDDNPPSYSATIRRDSNSEYTLVNVYHGKCKIMYTTGRLDTVILNGGQSMKSYATNLGHPVPLLPGDKWIKWNFGWDEADSYFSPLTDPRYTRKADNKHNDSSKDSKNAKANKAQAKQPAGKNKRAH